MGAFIVLYMMIDIPEGNADAELQSNVYEYSDGSIMARTGERNREIVDLAKVPKDVQRAFVAAENKSFYKDSGVDLRGTARGLLNTVSGKGAQGGSTITQQYVKNYYLTQEQTVTRKLKELVISLKLDREKSKDYILAGYINTSYYGRGAYGRPGRRAGLLPRRRRGPDRRAGGVPRRAAPGAEPVRLGDRQRHRQEARPGALELRPGQHGRAEVAGPGRPPGHEVPGARGAQGRPRHGGPDRIPGRGRQRRAQAAARRPGHRRGHEAGRRHAGPRRLHTSRSTSTRRSRRRWRRRSRPSSPASWTPTSARSTPTSRPAPSPSTRRRRAVVAMYGGVDYVKHYTNNATRDDYQAASTFKPVILAAAVDQDAETQDGVPITANTIYDGTSERPVLDGGKEVGFAPPNEDDRSYGDITVQEAMNKSVNSVFAQMGIDVRHGPRSVETAGDTRHGDRGHGGPSPRRPWAVWARARWRWPASTPPSTTTAQEGHPRRSMKSVEHKDRAGRLPRPGRRAGHQPRGPPTR
ncbi:hypothetical protein GCM10023238_34410 [Streptomyces heliomycini]